MHLFELRFQPALQFWSPAEGIMTAQSDLDRLQFGMRLVVEELIQIGDLKKH